MTEKRNMKSHKRNREGRNLRINSQKEKIKQRKGREKKMGIGTLFTLASGTVHVM